MMISDGHDDERNKSKFLNYKYVCRYTYMLCAGDLGMKNKNKDLYKKYKEL
jgi:predicted phosphodiesterase